jgi:hypothetical protein
MSERNEKITTQALVKMASSLNDLVRVQEAMMKAIVEIGILFKQQCEEGDDFHIESLTNNEDGSRTAVFTNRDPNQLALDERDMNGE